MSPSTTRERTLVAARRHHGSSLAILGGLLLLVALGCDRRVGELDVHLVTADVSTALASKVASIRLRVESPEEGVIIKELPFEPGGSRTLTAVPLGPDRVIEVQGLTEDGLEHSRGRSLAFEIQSGQNRLDLYVAQVDVFTEAASPPVDATARGGHEVVTLEDGRVLLVGGGASLELVDAVAPMPRRAQLSGPIAEADLFDPTSGRISAAGQCGGGEAELCLEQARLGAASGTSSSGEAIVAGGLDDEGEPVSSTEAVSSSGLTFEALTGEVPPRLGGALIETPAGALLIGGWTSADEPSAATDGVEIGADGTVEVIDDLLECPRAEPTVVVVGSRAVLFGGLSEEGVRDDYEVLRISPSPVTSLGCDPLPSSEPPPGVAPRLGAVAVALDDDVAAFIGGVEPDGSLSSEVDLLDLRTGTFCHVGRLGTRRYLHDAVVLPDGRVLVIGGIIDWSEAGSPNARTSPHLDLSMALILLDAAASTGRALECDDLPGSYDAVLDSDIRTLTRQRVAPAATLLDNGMVLVSGGFGPGPESSPGLRPLDNAELFVP